MTFSFVIHTDMNECLVDKGGCSDICNNTIGSYYCLCSKPEDILLQDGLTCDNPNNIRLQQGGNNSLNTGEDFSCNITTGGVLVIAILITFAYSFI